MCPADRPGGERSGGNDSPARRRATALRTRLNGLPYLSGLLAFFATSTCIQAVRPTASYRTLELGGSAVAVGVIAAAYGALSAIAAVPCGRLVDRLGPRRFLVGGLAVLAGSCALSAAAPSVLTLAGAQALTGLGQISMLVAVETIMANRLDTDRGFAWLTVAGGLGQMMGPLMAGALIGLNLGGVFGGRGTTLVFAASGVVALVGLAVALWGPAAEPTSQEGSGARIPVSSITSIVRRPGMTRAIMASVAMVGATDLIVEFLPVVGEARGIAPATIGVLLSLRAAATLLSRMTVTTMLRHMPRERLLLAAMVASGGAMVGVALVSPVWLMGLLIAVVGFGLGVGAPMTMAWVAVLAPAGGRGTAMAVRMTGNRIGQAILPIAGGAFAGALGPGAVFLFVAGTLAGGAACVWRVPPAALSNGPSAPPED